MFKALVDCRHRAAIVTGSAQCSNILMCRQFRALFAFYERWKLSSNQLVLLAGGL
jgi:hypothetical protein